MRQVPIADTRLAPSLQLSMDFAFPHSADSLTVWLAVTERSETSRLVRWLSRRSNPGNAPFFLDASRGAPLVGAGDPIVLLHPPEGDITLLLPKEFPVVDVHALLLDILRTGRPQGIWGPTAFLHDALLIKGDIGNQPDSNGRSSRSPFDLAVERLCNREFRENAAAISTICEATLRYPVPNEMRILVERVLVEAAAREALCRGEDSISHVVGRCASKFHTMGYHDAAAEMRRIATRARLLEGNGQYELFHDVPAPRSLQPPKQGLRYVRCSLLPLVVQTRVSRAPTDPMALTRDDEAHKIGRIDPRHVRRWLADVIPLSLTPVIGTKRLSASDAIEISVTMVPQFMHAFAERHTFFPKVRSSHQKWSLSPRLSGRSFKPRRKLVAVGETATFTTTAAIGGEETALSLSLLTPRNRTVILTLPIRV